MRCGGGFNHRFGLDDAILIKDNHIAVAGGIRAVLERAKAAAGHLVKIEIEVDTLDQLREVLDVGFADVGAARQHGRGDHAQGGADGRREISCSKPPAASRSRPSPQIAATGVDYASSGWITHSAPNLDVALDIEM